MSFWKQRIYADAAAATPLSARARAELLRLLGAYGNAGALHREALEAKGELEHAREIIAASIGAHPDEIVFTSSGTEANNLALQGVLRPLIASAGEVHAITTAIEHQSILVPLNAMAREGLYVTELPVDSEGLVTPQAVAESINEQTALVSIQLVNSEVGTIEPVREIAKAIRRARKQRAGAAGQEGAAPGTALPLLFHTDASQAPLWADINVERLGVDLMTLDAQKVLGPKGVGCLYIKRGVPIEPILWGGSQERSLRGGTPNVPLAGSFAVALADATRGTQERAERIAAVRDLLWSEIKRLLPSALVNGPQLDPPTRHGMCGGACRAANNLSISIPGLDGEMAVVAMDAEGIAVSTRSACNTADEEPSHVIKALGTPKELSKTAVRITLLPTATAAHAMRIARTLADVAKRYKQ